MLKDLHISTITRDDARGDYAMVAAGDVLVADIYGKSLGDARSKAVWFIEACRLANNGIDKDLIARLDKIQKLVDAHQNKQHWHLSASLPEEIESVIQHYQDIAHHSLKETKDFRDGLLSYLRGLQIVLDMTANAHTHGEKNARLRGGIEIINSMIAKLSKVEFSLQFRLRYWPDLFNSDYPVRHHLDKIRELEDKVEQLEQQLKQKPIAQDMAQAKG